MTQVPSGRGVRIPPLAKPAVRLSDGLGVHGQAEPPERTAANQPAVSNEALRTVITYAIESWVNRGWLILPGPTDLMPQLVTRIAAAVLGTPELLDALVAYRLRTGPIESVVGRIVRDPDLDPWFEVASCEVHTDVAVARAERATFESAAREDFPHDEPAGWRVFTLTDITERATDEQ